MNVPHLSVSSSFFSPIPYAYALPKKLHQSHTHKHSHIHTHVHQASIENNAAILIFFRGEELVRRGQIKKQIE